jgi:uncharacterized membrane protein
VEKSKVIRVLVRKIKLLFPVILTSFFTVILLSFINFAFIWNLFLAWLPLGYALVAEISRMNHKHRLFTYLMYFLWFIFFPNSIYVISDFIHFATAHNENYYLLRMDLEFWFALIAYIAFVFNGVVVGLISLRIIHIHLRRRLGNVWSVIGINVYLVLVGFGIFIGRFLRWNSWHVFTKPQEIALDFVQSAKEPMFYKFSVGTTLLFYGISIMLYVALLSFSNFTADLDGEM